MSLSHLLITERGNTCLPEIHGIASGNGFPVYFLFWAYNDISLYFPCLPGKEAAQDLINI